MAEHATNDELPKAAAWRLIEPYWDSVDIYRTPIVFLEGFERLPEAARHLYAIWRFDAEVGNGGFHQLFYNPTGILAPEALEGLRVVGLDACAKLAEEAIKKFGEPYPRDHDLRYEVLKSLEQPGNDREQWDPFYKLDHEYYAAAEREHFDARIDEFARRHA